MSLVPLLHAWVGGPVLLLALAWGSGWLVARWAGSCPPSGTVLISGTALLIVVGNATTTLVPLARMTVPVCLALALAGWSVWALDRSQERPSRGWPWRPSFVAPLVFTCVVLVSGAAVLASGTPTWAGWVMLDDGASFLGFSDWLLDHGRVLPTQITSTYERLIDVNFGDNDLGNVDNYPTGLFVPLGVLAALARMDGAWLLQPLMASSAGMLALLLYPVLRPILVRRWLAALAAIVAAQASTYLAYALWGGLKEAVLAPMVGLVAVSVGCAVRAKGLSLGIRRLVPGAAGALALFAIGSGASLGYVAPLAAALSVLVLLRVRPQLGRMAVVAVVAGAGAWLALVATGRDPITERLVPQIDDMGNLVRPLSPWQAVGIWPSGDFRFDPVVPAVAYVLIGIAAAAAAVGLIGLVCLRRWELPLWAGSSLVVVAYAQLSGGPWLAGKAIAVASPAVLALAFAGAGIAARAARVRARQSGSAWAGTAATAGAVAASVAVASGVLWSNALAYQHAWLAPWEQQRELEAIGERFAGQGPTVMLDYAPYAVRHFLRDLDAQGASELRVDPLLTREGFELAKGTSADVDAFAPQTLAAFDLLVLRRSPSGSLPPSAYDLAWRGTWYDVWQRDASRPLPVADLPLASGASPAGVPMCADVQRLAEAVPSGTLVAMRSDPVLTADAAGVLDIPADGDYELWQAGSWPGELSIRIDGNLLHAGHSIIEGDPASANPLGTARLSAGLHQITYSYSTPWWAPGAQAVPLGLGPLAAAAASVAVAGAEGAERVTVPAAEAGSLCGKPWDRIEAFA